VFLKWLIKISENKFGSLKNQRNFALPILRELFFENNEEKVGSELRLLSEARMSGLLIL
jgi:hypothetical protein